ncbi:MAG: EAL domain-containing protein [Paracoccaceae bacterium]
MGGSDVNFEAGALPDSPLAAAIQQRDANILQTVTDALRNRHVMLAYQPVVQARDVTKPAFFEGLIRVLDDTGRIVPAHEFIGTIENREEGRIIDSLALEYGMAALDANPGIRLSVNMSARSIGYPAWERILEEGLARDPRIGERLILEITESSAMAMPDLVVDFMARGHRAGIAFGLDDFGAGYTAFRYFKDFCFDMVKIDGSFIEGIHEDPDNQVLTEALVSIARQFDMFTVAEGVQDRGEAEFLIEAGVDCLQGFLFGAPRVAQRITMENQSRTGFGT